MNVRIYCLLKPFFWVLGIATEVVSEGRGFMFNFFCGLDLNRVSSEGAVI